MLDQKSLYDKQLSEFLYEFKNRFSQINSYVGMPGKVGYSAKLNRTDVNATMLVFLTERFPFSPPVVIVTPKFPHEIIDSYGNVMDDSLRLWNINSTLKNAVGAILNKLERGTSTSYNRSNTNVDQGTTSLIPQQDEDGISAELMKDLNNKTIEELILINYNPEEYVFQFTQNQRNNNSNLLQEVSTLSETYESRKAQYEEIKKTIEECRKQYEEKENELKEIYNQKQIIDNNFTVEKLTSVMKQFIDDKYQKPRQKITNEFLTKKINFESFQENFKDLSMKYHYYSLIKDKLNLYK